MFEKNFFAEKPNTLTGFNRVGGNMGMIGLDIVKALLLIYSGYHGVNAVSKYGGNGELSFWAMALGILSVELVLMSIYIAVRNGKIVGYSQSIAAAITYSIAFGAICLVIVGDSQTNAGLVPPDWLITYLRWGLPLAPPIMGLGGVAIHLLSPDQIRLRKESRQQAEFLEATFTAQMAKKEAELEAQEAIANMQLNIAAQVVKDLTKAYDTDEMRAAIAARAREALPSVMSQAGLLTSGNTPPTNERKEDDQASPLIVPAQESKAPYKNGHPTPL